MKAENEVTMEGRSEIVHIELEKTNNPGQAQEMAPSVSLCHSSQSDRIYTML